MTDGDDQDSDDRGRTALVATMKLQAEDREKAEAWARRGKECPIQRPMWWK